MVIQLNNLKSAVTITQFQIEVFTLSPKGIIRYLFTKVFPLSRYTTTPDQFWTDLSLLFQAIVYTRLYAYEDVQRCTFFANRLLTIGYPSAFRQIIGFVPLGGEINLAGRNIVKFVFSKDGLTRIRAWLDNDKCGDKLLDITGQCDSNKIPLSEEDVYFTEKKVLLNVFCTNRTDVGKTQIVQKNKVTGADETVTRIDHAYDLLIQSTNSSKVSPGFIFFAFLTPFVSNDQSGQLQLLFNLLGKCDGITVKEIFTLQNSVVLDAFKDSLVLYDNARSTNVSELTGKTRTEIQDVATANRLPEGAKIKADNVAQESSENVGMPTESQTGETQPAQKTQPKASKKSAKRGVSTNALLNQPLGFFLQRGVTVTLSPLRRQ